ncbi:hypothetical protein CJ179_28445 [Rhodococcus sp. ACS1]|uniref:Uncharacterized protein n=5 Tax=Nocardiaceae TaxID=85025 RepID=A0A1H4REQ4_9NOCA|nr:hypothetical protein CJ179_28445 [Rhodococcus sp. ACS1]SEC30343.1 hypothetical protein SAMN04490239_3601 [Rhodococcus koreensis]
MRCMSRTRKPEWEQHWRALEDGMDVAIMLREHHYLDASYYLHADRHEQADSLSEEIDPNRTDTGTQRRTTSVRRRLGRDGTAMVGALGAYAN